jgi:hypothetical protein
MATALLGVAVAGEARAAGDSDHKPLGHYFTHDAGTSIYRCKGTVAVEAIDSSTGFDPDKANYESSRWYVFYPEEEVYIDRVHRDARGVDDWYLIHGETRTYYMVAVGDMTQSQADHLPSDVAVHFRAWIGRADFDKFFDPEHCQSDY